MKKFFGKVKDVVEHGSVSRAERRRNDNGDIAPTPSVVTSVEPSAPSSIPAVTPVVPQPDTDERITDLEAQILTTTQTHQEELAEVRRQAELIRDEARTNSERANELARDILALENDINAAIRKQSLTELALSKLRASLETLKQSRRDSVIIRSINAYLHNMRKLETLGSGLELQAIANILGYNIEAWKLYDNHPYEIYTSRTIKPGTLPIRICLNKQQFGRVYYSIVLPTYNATATLQDIDTQELEQDVNSMFMACLKSLPVAPENKINEEYLSFSAYSLRLETCESLNTDDRSILDVHLKKLIAQIEVKNFTYSMLDSTLESYFTQRKIIDKIKNIIVDHYFPTHIQDKLETGSNGSDRSLGKEIDLELLADVDISVSLKEHDIRVNKFLDSATTKYLGEFDNNIIGGVIELQSIANIYNLHINLKAYKNNSCDGPAHYVQVFKRSLLKDSQKNIFLALINAGTSNATFIILDSAGKPLVPQLSQGTVFSVCANIIETTPEKLKERIVKHFTDHKENEVKSFYKRFIISEAQYSMGGLSEFDLVPTSDLNEEAEKLKAVRRSLLKITDAILDQIGNKIEKELSAWRPLQQAMSDRSVLVAFIERFRFHLIMGILANVFAGYNSFAGEKYVNSSIQTYELTSSFNAAIIILTNISNILKQYATEKARAFVVRSAQDLFVKNLPLDKLSEVNIFFNSTEPMSYVNPERTIAQQALFGIWSTDTCSKITFNFKISQEETFSITKAEYVASSVKVRNNYAAPLVVCISICQVTFIGLSINDAKQQVKICKDGASKNATAVAECDTKYNSPDIAIGNFVLALVVTAILMQTEFQGPKRTCEFELSKALATLKNTYKGNEGKLPLAMSELLQAYKIDNELTNALTTVPQMINIERTIFKFKKQLKTYIFSLKSHISTLESNNLPTIDYEMLLLKVESIMKILSPENIAELYKEDPKVFVKMMADLHNLNDHSQRLQTSHQSAMVFSAQPAITTSLRGLIGAFKFRSRTKPKV